MVPCRFDLAGGRVGAIPTAHCMMGGVAFRPGCGTEPPRGLGVAAALRARHRGGAALDVVPQESLDAAAGVPFRDVPDPVLTPHSAGATRESNVRASRVTARAVRRHLSEGRRP